MKRIAARAVLAFVLSTQSSPLMAQVPGQPRLGRDTWYEVMLKRINDSHKNYGGWFEERRRALLAGSIQNPFFWYSFWITVCMALLMFALLKSITGSREAEREHARIEADIRNHDLYSREKAQEAIERYNRHIEECNRSTGASGSGEGRPIWGGSAVESLKTELERVACQLEATAQERTKLQEELRQKSLVVADLSTRLDALSKRANGPRADNGAGEMSLAGADGNRARLVNHINRLQEELYAERQKNKRLKGG